MDAKEIKELAIYINSVADHIPNALTGLKDAVSLAATQLLFYCTMGVNDVTFRKALEFAKTIPKVESMQDPELTDWMIHSRAYLKYWNYEE